MLCGEPNETRDHLYCVCPYSFTVWLKVGGGLLAVQASPDTFNYFHHGAETWWIIYSCVWCSQLRFSTFGEREISGDMKDLGSHMSRLPDSLPKQWKLEYASWDTDFHTS